MRYLGKLFVTVALGATLVACDQSAQDSASRDHDGRLPQQVFWGDLHLHSRFSFDSFSFGNRSLTPDDAFRFAKGEPVQAHNGDMAQLSRPLDFLMVSDHAEYLGVLASIQEKRDYIMALPLGQRWSKYLADGEVRSIVAEFMATIQGTAGLDGYPSPEIMNTMWRQSVEAAERHNAPGSFSAIIGYEWTSMIDGDNLHRVVVFRGGAEDTAELTPFSSLDSVDPEDLWASLEAYEASHKNEVLAIPHNGNLSNGLMFDDKRINGQPLDRAYAEMRMRWEPIYEMTQVKGDGETHPLVSPDDGFADFENWDETDIAMNKKPEALKKAMYEREYARPALRSGLKHEADIGVNPFKFGMIGSTDSHTAMATAESGNYYGKFADSEPGPDRLTNKMGGALWANRFLAASGYAAIWATENTREALFDAMKRREVYASTGPRIQLRLFGGFDFSADDINRPDMVAQAYARGVPMGGDLPASETAPGFLVSASKDPESAHLDRIQIVKGWLAEDGTTRERVYDVAWSGDRVPDAKTGAVGPVGSTVNVAEASYSNDIGAESLTSYWQDPDFDPSERAFYYARVLEIPTPRWSTYDAARYKQPLPQDVPHSLQQRAYSSPIWYTPSE
jgi:hypothetical protein